MKSRLVKVEGSFKVFLLAEGGIIKTLVTPLRMARCNSGWSYLSSCVSRVSAGECFRRRWSLTRYCLYMRGMCARVFRLIACTLDITAESIHGVRWGKFWGQGSCFLGTVWMSWSIVTTGPWRIWQKINKGMCGNSNRTRLSIKLTTFTIFNDLR